MVDVDVVVSHVQVPAHQHRLDLHQLSHVAPECQVPDFGSEPRPLGLAHLGVGCVDGQQDEPFEFQASGPALLVERRGRNLSHRRLFAPDGGPAQALALGRPFGAVPVLVWVDLQEGFQAFDLLAVGLGLLEADDVILAVQREV